MRSLSVVFLFLISFSAAAQNSNPDPLTICDYNETKLMYASTIAFGSRIQLENPMFCTNGNQYGLLAFHKGATDTDYTANLCELYHMGKTVNYETRLIDNERVAIFSAKGDFEGVNTVVSNVSMGSSGASLYYSLVSLTCDTK